MRCTKMHAGETVLFGTRMARSETARRQQGQAVHTPSNQQRTEPGINQEPINAHASAAVLCCSRTAATRQHGVKHGARYAICAAARRRRSKMPLRVERAAHATTRMRVRGARQHMAIQRGKCALRGAGGVTRCAVRNQKEAKAAAMRRIPRRQPPAAKQRAAARVARTLRASSRATAQRVRSAVRAARYGSHKPRSDQELEEQNHTLGEN